MRALALCLLVAMASGAEPAFSVVDNSDGIVLESRPVDGSKFPEFRATVTSPKPARALCQAAFDESRAPSSAPEVKSRKVISESADERVDYDQLTAPLVSDRDYTWRMKRTRAADGSCRIDFSTANDLAPPLPSGVVRIDVVRGAWTFTPDGTNTKVVYTVYTDPGGSLPAFIVVNGEQRSVLKSVKRILEKASGS
jgi:hypothetical protein